jgi:transposase InsO family protein
MKGKRPQPLGEYAIHLPVRRTNGQVERVIKTLMQMWHEKYVFETRQGRKISLARFVNYYNTVKPHAGINTMTPYELLTEYFGL